MIINNLNLFILINREFILKQILYFIPIMILILLLEFKNYFIIAID